MPTRNVAKDTLSEIRRRLKMLSPSEQKVARTVLAGPEKVALLPLRLLAQECAVSEPTILRFCRGFGFSGYQDLKMSLIPQILDKGLGTRDLRSDGEPRKDGLIGIAETLAESVRATLDRVDFDSLRAAARAIAASERVLVAGLGGAAGVAYVLADSLTGLGKLSFCSHDPSYLQVLPESLGPGDVVVGISHSGETEEVFRLLQRTAENNVVTVAITNYEGAPVDLASGLTLFTTVDEDLLGSYSPAARIAELSLVTALIDGVTRAVEENEG